MNDQSSPKHSETRKGFTAALLAYLMWGVFPLYFPLLEPAGALEILAQRMAWSLIVVVLILRITRGSNAFHGVRLIVADRRQFGLLVIAAVLVSVNWGVYIWAVNSGHVVESSLGYFINPLITIVFGVTLLGERLRRAQWLAVAIGAAAIVLISVDYGHLPWIALTLAFSFGGYGLCKKLAAAPAVDSLAVETGVLFVPALVAISVIAAQGNLAFGRHGVGNALLLAGSGLVTAVPLLLFAAGTRRLPLSVVGLLQYLTPVLQFAVGVWIRHEKLPTAELIGFCLVWVALGVLAVDALRARGFETPTTSAPQPPSSSAGARDDVIDESLERLDQPGIAKT